MVYSQYNAIPCLRYFSVLTVKSLHNGIAIPMGKAKKIRQTPIPDNNRGGGNDKIIEYIQKNRFR